jgi:transposase-like protein
MRWMHHYAPESKRRRNRFARLVGTSWRVNETCVKIPGHRVYLCRAVDRAGKTVDFRLSARRDVAAATTFFRKAVKSQGSTQSTITLDGYAASHRPVHELAAAGQLATDTKLRSSKHLNNLIEQDRRGDHHCRHRIRRQISGTPGLLGQSNESGIASSEAPVN